MTIKIHSENKSDKTTILKPLNKYTKRFLFKYLHFRMKANYMKSPESTDFRYIRNVEPILLLLHTQYGCFCLLSSFFHRVDAAEKQYQN